VRSPLPACLPLFTLLPTVELKKYRWNQVVAVADRLAAPLIIWLMIGPPVSAGVAAAVQLFVNKQPGCCLVSTS